MLNSLNSTPLRTNKRISLSTLHGCWNLFCHVLHFGTLVFSASSSREGLHDHQNQGYEMWEVFVGTKTVNTFRDHHLRVQRWENNLTHEKKLSFKKVSVLKTGINIKYTKEYIGYSHTHSLPVQCSFSGLPVITSVSVCGYTRRGREFVNINISVNRFAQSITKKRQQKFIWRTFGDCSGDSASGAEYITAPGLMVLHCLMKFAVP